MNGGTRNRPLEIRTNNFCNNYTKLQKYYTFKTLDEINLKEYTHILDRYNAMFVST